MADAVAVAAPSVSDDLFWCHQCRAEIHPSIPDYTCPQCSGGFVEPVQESHRTGTGRLAGTGPFSADDSFWMGNAFDEDDDDDVDDDDADMHESNVAYSDFNRLLRHLIRSMPSGYDDDDHVPLRPLRRERNSNRSSAASVSASNATGENANESSSALGNEVPDNDAAAAAQQQQQQQQQQQAAGSSDSSRNTNRNRPNRNRNRRNRRRYGTGILPLEDILQQMFDGGPFGASAFGGGGGGGNVFITGNPGDYAFDTRGLDDIITQLLNQYEGGGAAPANEEEIINLPDDVITAKDVASNVQCPVCFDEYEVGQQVKRMACKHAFHEQCIVPWLKIHGTCPVCRSDMKGNAPEENPPPPAYDAGSDWPGASGFRPPPPQPTFSFASFQPNFGTNNLRQRSNASGVNRSSSSNNNPNNNNNNNNNEGSSGGGGSNRGGTSSSSSYLDQVD